MKSNETKNKLILRVNELHHDLEEKFYGDENKKMFDSERSRWNSFFNTYLNDLKENIMVLEIGVGTGFVPVVF